MSAADCGGAWRDGQDAAGNQSGGTDCRYQQRSLAMAQAMGEERWVVANLNGIATTYLEMADLTVSESRLPAKRWMTSCVGC
ncbi:MAG TPA: hypothetical protein P5121_18305 [Caldilineaceae bacterium]|nr:hypothetical protein [Caldilineaceae bacterium]